jgi:ParB family transcriptional regulator, chromosome partitioning protein
MPDASRALASFGAQMRDSVARHPEAPPAPATPAARLRATYLDGALSIPVDDIVPDPGQPRKEFAAEALERLAADLRARGQLLPVRVRWDAAADRWVLVSGERRWRAARRAGLATLAAIEDRPDLDPAAILEAQLVENCLRDDLKPVEQAHAFRALMDARGLSKVELAARLHLSPPDVSKALALLDLPASVRTRVDAGQVSPSAGYELSRAADPATAEALAAEVAAGRLTRDQVRARVRARPAPERYDFRNREGKVTVVAAPGGSIRRALEAALADCLAHDRDRPAA